MRQQLRGLSRPRLDHFLASLGTPPERVPQSVPDKASQYQSLLAGRSTLVVLENVADSATIDALAPAQAGSAVVVTSRRRLSSADVDLLVVVDKLDEGPAVACIQDAAGAALRHDNAFTEDDLTSLTTLCGRFPLALRIAGAMLGAGVIGEPSELVGLLSQSAAGTRVLTFEGAELVAVSEYAYRALSDGAQTLLRRLALLPISDFSRWIATVVLAGTNIDAGNALGELVSLNLVTPATDKGFEAHNFIVEFARQRVAVENMAEEVPTVSEAALEGYASRAQQCRRMLEPERPPTGGASSHDVEPDQAAEAESWLRREHGNLIAMMNFAAERSFPRELVAIANSLPTFFIIRGTWNDWEPGMQAAARAAESTNDLVSLGYCLQALANLERTLARGTGRALIERSLDCFTRAADVEGRAYVLNDLGLVKMYDREWTAAINALRESEELLTQLSNLHLALHPVRNTGITLLESGEVEEGILVLERAAAGFAARSDRRWEAFTLGDLGKAYRLVGRVHDAEESFTRAVGLLGELGEDRWAAVTKLRYADLLRTEGRNVEAIAAGQASERTFKALGDPLWAARAATGAALAEAAAGHAVEALARVEEAVSVFRRFDFPPDECWALVSISRIARLVGDVEAAARAYREAEGVAAEMDVGAGYLHRLVADAGPDVR
jgi:tetratricopeptide (TPR) repeat protein